MAPKSRLALLCLVLFTLTLLQQAQGLRLRSAVTRRISTRGTFLSAVKQNGSRKSKHLGTCSCHHCRASKGTSQSTLGKPASFELRAASADVSSSPTTSSKPIPKVPSSAWKWPPVWPFPPDFLDVMNPALTEAVVSPPESPNAVDERTTKFRNHLAAFTEKGSNVLEIGAPGDVNLLSGDQINVNRFNLDLENIDTVTLPYEAQSFDRIVISSAIEALSDPRDTFREIWRVLKPGGQALICFTRRNKAKRPLRMWTTMTDEQKIWIVGSYFHYSAGEGWMDIEGYDLYDVKGTDSEKIVFQEKKAEDQTAYVVQAKKSATISKDDAAVNPQKYIESLLYGARHMEGDDKEFTSLRMTTEYNRASTAEEKAAVLENVQRLPSIYKILKNVKEIVIPAPVKAMLATFLVSTWENTPEQCTALQRGVGLMPADEFWTSLGTSTASMTPREKIAFLSNVIPLAGKHKNLARLPNVLAETIKIIQQRVPQVEAANLQGFASDIVVSDYLYASSAASFEPDSKTEERLYRYLTTVDLNKLQEMLNAQKNERKFM